MEGKKKFWLDRNKINVSCQTGTLLFPLFHTALEKHNTTGSVNLLNYIIYKFTKKTLKN